VTDGGPPAQAEHDALGGSTLGECETECMFTVGMT
jgi:hypothetical protein